MLQRMADAESETVAMVRHRWKRRRDMRAEHLMMVVTFLIVLLVLAVAVISILR